MIGEWNVRHRKIKRILNKYYTKKEGQKIRCSLRIPYDHESEYSATYYKKVIMDGKTQRMPYYVHEDEIRRIILDYYSSLDVIGISVRYDGWGDPRGFQLAVAVGMPEKGPKKELKK